MTVTKRQPQNLVRYWWIVITLMLLLSACDGSSVSQSDDDVSRTLAAWSAGDMPAALEYQRQAIAKDPDNAELYVVLGRLYLEGKDQSAVRKAFDKAIALGIERSIVAADLARLDESSPPTNPWQQLRQGQWLKIHEQRPTDIVFFQRQKHGGSAFDTQRNQIVLFGSDTHGKDWSNSPLLFDTARLEWRRLYQDDEASSYQVNGDGLPVAGEEGQHPWAMHTFGAVEYDAARDELVVSSYPKHMTPGRFSDALAQVWPRVARHPTWVLSLATGQWRALDDKAVDFFPYATAFDSHRGVIVGYRNSGAYELAGEPRQWRRVLPKGLLGYHNNAVYDNWYKKVIVLGSNKNSNDIVVYDPATQQQQKMPTPGVRPPKDQHIPMAFHPRRGKTVALIDQVPPGVRWDQRDKTITQTWLYDLFEDRWEQVVSATLPFGCGMNYNLEYDPSHDVLLLVTSEPGRQTSVWALRL